jgi:hypothetical protein
MRADIGRKRKPYKIKKKEERGGEHGKQYHFTRTFWKQYSMDEVITWSQEELDKKIDAFLDEFAARQIKQNPRWCWPEDPQLDIELPKKEPKKKGPSLRFKA